MRLAYPWFGGSALSIMLRYDDPQSLETDMLDQDNSTDAWITSLVNGELHDTIAGVSKIEAYFAMGLSRTPYRLEQRLGQI